MSLSASDLQDIRSIIRQEVPSIVRSEVSVQIVPLGERLASVEGRLEAVENDVKDIYFMVADLQVVVGGKA